MKKTQKKTTSVTKLKQVKKPEPKKPAAKPVKKATPKAKAGTKKPAKANEKPAKKEQVTESAYLLTVLRQVIAALKWEIHIPRTKEGEVVPYAIIGRPLFANLVKDHLEKVHFNDALHRSFVK